MPSPSHRNLLQALAISLLLHAVLLSSQVDPFAVRLDLPAPAITALISPLARPDRSPALRVPARASPGVPSRPSTTDPRSAAAPRVAVAEPVPTEVAAKQVTAPARESGTSLVAAVRSGVAVGAALPGTAPAIAHEVLSAEDVSQYRLSLASAARRFKRYPALASQRGWEGTVELALNVSAVASVPEVVLLRSSGRGVLDEQALAMLTQAARVTPLPDGLKARSFRILLPVQFSLEDAQ